MRQRWGAGPATKQRQPRGGRGLSVRLDVVAQAALVHDLDEGGQDPGIVDAGPNVEDRRNTHGLADFPQPRTRRLKGGTWNEADVEVTVDADQTGVPSDYEKVTATSKTPIVSETQGRQFIRITVERP